MNLALWQLRTCTHDITQPPHVEPREFSPVRFPRFSHVHVLRLFQPSLTTATVTGATRVQKADLGADAGHVKIKRAAALVPNITHLSDWDISLHDTHADRNSFDNRTIIGSQLHDWMVGNPTTNVTFMIYNGGESVDVPIEFVSLRDGGRLLFARSTKHRMSLQWIVMSG